MQGNDLICLNGRNPSSGAEYTYQHGTMVNHASVIDVICVSSQMMRRSYRAKVLPDTLTGDEWHYPVIADLRLSRTVARSHRTHLTTKWNKFKLKDDKKLLEFIETTARHLTDARNDLLEESLPDSAAEAVERFSSLITTQICQGATECIGTTTHRTHRRTHRQSKAVSKHRRKLNTFQRRNFKKLFKRDSPEARTVLDLREKLQQAIHREQQTRHRRLARLVADAEEGDNRKLFERAKEFRAEREPDDNYTKTSK